MTNTSDSPNFRALCAELVVTWDAKSDLGFSDFRDKLSDIVARARSAGPWIVRNVAPPAGSPPDESLYELWEQEGFEGDFQDCRRFYRAALERWGR